MEELHRIILTKNLRKNIYWKHLINPYAYLTIPSNILKIKLCMEIEKRLKRDDTYLEYYADDEEYYDEIFNLKRK